MKLHRVALFALPSSLAACAATASAPQDPTQTSIIDLPTGPTFSLQIDGGLRKYGSDSWDHLDDQAALQLLFVITPETWPLGIEAGLGVTDARGDVGTDRRDSRTFDASLGLRYEALLDSGFTFAGGAGAFAARTVDHDDGDWFDAHAIDADGWYGWYLRGGVYREVSEHVRLGLDVTWRDGSDLEIEGDTRNGDSTQYALSVIVGL